MDVRSTGVGRVSGLFFLCISLGTFILHAAKTANAEPGSTETVDRGALADERHRVIVSTDIGGTDPDDFQSMVHLLVYADRLDIEGLVSSPFGPGRKEHILEVIDCYEKDFANLRTYSSRYPTPDALRSITKQGETEAAPYAGVRRSTEGSEWIVACGRRDDPRPLHVLVWGGIEDLAQALHGAPDIVPKLRVYYIGGPNKKWGPDAYQYIVDNHAALWIIESNATYRGWFNGGDQAGGRGNREFVKRHVANHGALGKYYASRLDAMKMGDTPSVGWLLGGEPTDPTRPGWGGQFVRAWDRSSLTLSRMPMADDRVEVFRVVEMILPLGADLPERPVAELHVENQILIGHLPHDGTVRFRFCPKAVGSYEFALRSNIDALDGKRGGITAVELTSESARQPSADYPNWWTDDPALESAEGEHRGARTVSRWRREFLADFAEQMDRCVALDPTGD